MVHPTAANGRSEERVRFDEFGRAAAAAAASARLRLRYCVRDAHVGGYEGRFGNNFIERRNLRAREEVGRAKERPELYTNRSKLIDGRSVVV